MTAAAITHRIRTPEKHPDAELFKRQRGRARLNHRGRAYLEEVQRILTKVRGVSQRQERELRRVRIGSVEAVAEKWLLPKVTSFKASHPGTVIELETSHSGAD